MTEMPGTEKAFTLVDGLLPRPGQGCSPERPAGEDSWNCQWNCEELPYLQLFETRGVTLDGRRRFVFDTYTVLVFLEAASLFHRRARQFQAPARSILVAAPGEVVAIQSLDLAGTSACGFSIPPEHLRRLCRDAGLSYPGIPGFEPHAILDPPLVTELLGTYFSCLRGFGKRELESRLRVGLRALFHGTSHPEDSLVRTRHERWAVRHAREMLEQRLQENLTLDELSEQVQLSKYHLLRLFREDIGLPPHAYQVQLRVARARVLLASGLPPGCVAQRVGFADQAHLTRCFRSVTRVTPARFQQRPPELSCWL